MKLSIVSTLYKSEVHIEEFYQRVTAVAKQLAGDDYEIIFVNDGSPDNSLEIAINLTRLDKNLILVDLSRNFGHHKAIIAGLEHAQGELVFLIDSDLEEEPEWLLHFDKRMQGENADVVYGQQIQRKGGWFERVSGNIFYTIFNMLAMIDHPRNIVTARLMTRRYVNALLQYKEREMVVSCLWVITGFKQVGECIEKKNLSKSTYGLSKKIEHVTNAITSFSLRPLNFIFYFGVVILVGSLSFAIALILQRLMMDRVIDGWTSLMVSIWFLGGLLISFVGIIGIYLGKIFAETKQRPHYIVRDIYHTKPKNE